MHQENIMCLRIKNPTPSTALPKRSNVSLIQPLDSEANLQKIKQEQNCIMSVQNPDYGKLCKPNGLGSSTDNLKERERDGVGSEGRGNCRLKEI